MTQAETGRLNELLTTVEWTDDTLRELAGFTGAEGFTFARGAQFPPGGLARLVEALPNLTGLAFSDSLLSLDDLTAVGGLARLGGLGLSGCHVGDEHIAALAEGRPPLTALVLSRTRITDAALTTVGASFPGLKDLLELSDTAVTDAGLPHLAPLSRLEVLWLDGTAVTDAGMPALAPAKRLTAFNLQRTAVTEAGLDAHFLAWRQAHEPARSRAAPDPAAVAACRALLDGFFAARRAQERFSALLLRFFVPDPGVPPSRDDRRHWIQHSDGHQLRFLAETRPGPGRLHLYAKELAGFHHYVVFQFAETPDGWRIENKRAWVNGRWERTWF
jgi:hypothetical protein